MKKRVLYVLCLTSNPLFGLSIGIMWIHALHYERVISWLSMFLGAFFANNWWKTMKFTNQYDKPAWESVGYTYPGLMTQSFSTLFGLWLAINYIPPQSPLMSVVWGACV